MLVLPSTISRFFHLLKTILKAIYNSIASQVKIISKDPEVQRTVSESHISCSQK